MKAANQITIKMEMVKFLKDWEKLLAFIHIIFYLFLCVTFLCYFLYIAVDDELEFCMNYVVTEFTFDIGGLNLIECFISVK